MAHNAPTFETPVDIRDCKDRLRLLRYSLRSIDLQLGDRDRRQSKDYATWRKKALSSKIYKQSEYDYLTAWLGEARRVKAGKELSIEDVNNPKALLRHVAYFARNFLQEDTETHETQLRNCLAVVDEYFQHSGAM